MAASTNMTPEQSFLQASIAAHTQWANESNRTVRTAAARKAAGFSIADPRVNGRTMPRCCFRAQVLNEPGVRVVQRS